MKVQATVIFPVNVEIDVPRGTPIETIQDMVKSEAERGRNEVEGVVHASRTHDSIVE